MTYGGDTYGGSSLGSTSETDEGAVARAVSTTSATTQATGTGTAVTTANAQTTTTTDATGISQTTALADAQTTASTTTTSAGATTGTASAQTTAATVAVDATLQEPAVEWRVTRNGTDVVDAVFDVDPVVDTANPFGDFAVVKMDDRGGQQFEDFPRGTRVDIAVSENFGITYENRFTGYVVERRENEQSGADVLEVEAYSFDQFLRRNTVTNDQTGNTITQALQDIVETDTPVSYVAGNIEVGDDQELTRGYQGEPVENVLRDLAFKSNNEDFGVNDDLEFFFRPRESVHIDRGIDNTQWFNYDIPELGKEAINEVEVWFDDGDESVIVDDGTDKLDLQDSLGLPDPGTQRAELNRPLITDISDAEDEGRKYLEFRNSTLSGTVTTFGLFDAEPGDTIDITIDPRGIDAEFVIAAIEYRWGRDETILTIVEKRGDVDDILTELNDSVQRQEMEGANRDAPKNRITTTNATGIVSITADADGNTADADRLVNDGRRYIRDAWTGKAYSAISNLVVGSDGGGLSRSNDTLRNQTNSASVSQTLPNSTSVTFDATITQTGVEEIGLEDGDGNLIMRAVFDSAVDLNGTVSVTLGVSNDDSVSRGVLTSDGQTAVRDVLASNSPALPNAYAYGDDDTPVSESDTALGNELVETSLDEILIQDADAQSEWETVFGSVADTTPVVIDATGPRVAQTSFTTEAENYDAATSPGPASDANYSNGQYVSVGTTTPQTYEWNFTTEYTIPAADFDVGVRFDETTGQAADLTWYLDDEQISTYSPSTVSLSWNEGIIAIEGTPPSSDVSAGAHTLRVEVNDDTVGAWQLDLVQPHDTRYTYTYDNTLDGSSGYLDGPELFPDIITRSFATAGTRRNVSEARFDLTANDVSNNFYVELANDGSTFTRVNNSQTGTVTFASPESGVDTNVGFGRYGSRTGATPKEGYLGQQIDAWNLFADVDSVVTDDIGATLSRAIIPPDTLSAGTTIREAGLKSDSTLLTRHILAEFDVLSGQRISSAETSLFTGDN